MLSSPVCFASTTLLEKSEYEKEEKENKHQL